jgi:AraC-like DNA-binding protein
MAASVLIYSIGYLSLRQPQIFARVVQKSEAEPALNSKIQTEERISYQKSGLTDVEAQNYLNNLLQIMEADKPYLNSDLTLQELAGKLSISTHNLSEIINTRLNRNFYDFINGYRVEEVKRRLADTESEKYSLLAIAFDSGFNSKSAFNTIFKKHTNTTPSQYRKQLK